MTAKPTALANVEISAKTLGHSVAACVNTTELRNVVQVVKDAAFSGDIKAAALLLRHCDVLPGRRCQPLEIDETMLGTLDGCLEASQIIFKELAAGQLDFDSAAALGAMVDRAMRGHQLQQGDKILGALEDGGRLPFYAEAQREVESFAEFIEKRDSDNG